MKVPARPAVVCRTTLSRSNVVGLLVRSSDKFFEVFLDLGMYKCTSYISSMPATMPPATVQPDYKIVRQAQLHQRIQNFCRLSCFCWFLLTPRWVVVYLVWLVLNLVCCGLFTVWTIQVFTHVGSICISYRCLLLYRHGKYSNIGESFYLVL